MLQYLTPTTLEKMYKDLDETRLAQMNGVNLDNLADRSSTYHELTNLIQEIDNQYKNITGEELWVKVADGNNGYSVPPERGLIEVEL